MGIVVENLTVRVFIKKKWVTILNNVSGKIPKGKMTALLGESGSGKTTFLNVLSGIACSSKNFKVRGKITVNGKPRDPKKWFEQFGYIRQQDYFIEGETVSDCIKSNTKLIYKTDNTEFINSTCEKYLRMLNIESIKDSPIKVISGGQKKRLSIALVLLKKPDILLLDEPFTGLDFVNSLNFANILEHLSSTTETTMIVSIHNGPRKVLEKFQAFIYLNNADPVFIGEIQELVETYKKIGCELPKDMIHIEHIQTLTLTECQFFDVTGGAELLMQFKDLYRKETKHITGGLDKMICSRHVIDLKPSIIQIKVFIERRIKLTFCRGPKHYIMKILPLTFFLLIFASCGLIKVLVKYGGIDDVIVTHLGPIDDLLQILDDNFVLLMFLFLNNMLLGNLFGIMFAEKDVVKDEMLMCKYNLVTYSIYASLHAYLYTLFVMCTLCLSCFLIMLGFTKTIIIFLKYIFLVSPVIVLFSLGFALALSTFRAGLGLKTSNQMSILNVFLMLGYISTCDGEARKMLYFILTLVNLVTPFIYTIVFLVDILFVKKQVADKLSVFSIANLVADHGKQAFTFGILDNYKFYIFFSALIGLLLMTGIAIQYKLRLPKYRI
ncbi:hypothetical protein EDEG_02692 [Edhazardia aedis USNM 41457]|uniref:ABC transporter domain-containing protein n=1 Tax=Edhazardia aedis (strain USNM 41457) TaxID=1003232 RepID=J9DNF8_EDHAE|nr:hypothetical protein EDEG_02692 [Edhazardia aedis USNM 41457]|eukprot:EJW02927.1 hypothetical protein EDEG_02692 [Edhazardia aedis USNM 41457]